MQFKKHRNFLILAFYKEVNKTYGFQAQPLIRGA